MVITINPGNTYKYLGIEMYANELTVIEREVS